VIVDYLDVFGTRIGPSEYDPPLIVDADRVLARYIALETFKTVAGRRVQGLKKGGGVQHNQLSASYLGEIRRETLRDHAALKNRLSNFSLEAPDHEPTYHTEIRFAKLSYLDEIPLANAGIREGAAVLAGLLASVVTGQNASFCQRCHSGALNRSP
jgi:hypothetical protein